MMAYLDKYELDTEFHDDYVVSPPYEWNLSQKRRAGLLRWKQEKIPGSGAIGTVYVQRGGERGTPQGC